MRMNAGLILQGKDPQAITSHGLQNSANAFALDNARQMAPHQNALAQAQARGAEMQVQEAEDQTIARVIDGIDRHPDKLNAYRAGLTILRSKGIEVPDYLQSYDPETFEMVKSIYRMPAAERTETERMIEQVRATEGDDAAYSALRVALKLDPDANAQLRGQVGDRAPSGYQFTDSGELRFIKGGPADPEVKDSLRGPGMSITTSDGTVIQQGKPVGRSGQNKMDALEIDTRDELARLERIEKSALDPDIADMNSLEGNLKRFGLEWQDFIASDSLTDEQAEYLTKVTTARGDILENVNFTIKQITGAAMTESEAKRIGATLPNINDSPRMFKAKLTRALERSRASIARYNMWRNQGLGGHPSQLGTLPEIEQQMEARFADLSAAVEADEMTVEEANGIFASEFGL